MEQLLLNEAERLITAKTVSELCTDVEDDREVVYAVGLLLMYAFGLDPERDPREREFLQGWLLPSLRRLSPTPFLQNEYYRTVQFPDIKVGNIELTHLRYEPFQLFPAGDLSHDKEGRLVAPLGFFSETFVYPALLQDGREWMTLTPNEIITMQGAVDNAHGAVLVLGLGLGYYTFSASRKKEVSSVTVVELEKRTIDLFREHLLPQFPDAEKIALIEGDAVDYLHHHCHGAHYDYIFVDIWHDVADGLPLYHQFKEIESRWPEHPEVDYWIEASMRAYE